MSRAAGAAGDFGVERRLFCVHEIGAYESNKLEEAVSIFRDLFHMSR